VNPTPVNMRNCLILLSMHVKILQKKCGPQITLGLFMIRPIKVKQFNSLPFCRYVPGGVYGVKRQRTRLWCAMSRFNSRLLQGILGLLFCFAVVVFFSFVVQNIIFVINYFNSFCNVNSFSILNILPICDRLWGYEDTFLASLSDLKPLSATVNYFLTN